MLHCKLPPAGANISAGSLSSMIDIIFLLIIFFVVTASFDREQIDDAVSLPTVDSAAIKTLPPERIMVNVLADGAVKVGFSQVSAVEAAEKLPGLMRSQNARPDTILIINGDRDTAHKFILTALNAAAQAGFSQVRINAEVNAERKP